MSMADEQLEAWKRERIEAINFNLGWYDHKGLLEYFKEVVAQIVIAAADVDDTDWPADLHLGYVIEKHLRPPTMDCI